MAADISDKPDDQILTNVLRSTQIVGGMLLAMTLVLAILAVVLVQQPGAGGSPILTWFACAELLVWLLLSKYVSKFIARRKLQRILSGEEEPADKPRLAGSLPAAIMLLIGVFVERRLAARGIYRPQVVSIQDRILMARQKIVVLNYGLLYGIGLMGSLGYWLDGELLALGVTGCVVLSMILQFPTPDRTRAWVLQQAQELERLHQATSLGTT